MLDAETNRRIDSCRDILVGKRNVPSSRTIEAEQALVNATRKLIRRFEGKIKLPVDCIWSAT